MHRKACVAALAVVLGAALPASAEILKGSLVVRGAEMS
jgi:hypothetical protein